ncbi:MAG: hypothetical protein WCH99_14780 [Verrucomicrobiota bacterium]
MNTETKTTTGFDNTPRKLADGLYETESGHRFWIEAGVLFMPAAALNRADFFSHLHLVRVVVNSQGWSGLFVRAGHLAELYPEEADGLRAIAAKYQVCL